MVTSPARVSGTRWPPRDVRLVVGAVGVSALGDFLLWVPLTLHLQAMTDCRGEPGARGARGGRGAGSGARSACTLIQERVPERLHGRALAAYNGLRNGAEVIALAAGGLLVAALGGRVTLALAGGLPVLAALLGLALYRASREPPVQPATATA